MRQLIPLRQLHRALGAVAGAALLGSTGCTHAASPSPGSLPPQSTVRIAGAGTPGMTLRTSADVSAITATVGVAPDSVWRVLPSVYAALGIPLTTMDSATRLIGNEAFKVRRSLAGVPLMRYLDCGGSPGAPNAETFDIRLSIFTQLQSSGDGRTIVATTAQATARSPSFAGTEVACASNGRLEAHVNARVADAAGG